MKVAVKYVSRWNKYCKIGINVWYKKPGTGVVPL